jgi:hypothetical protein
VLWQPLWVGYTLLPTPYRAVARVLYFVYTYDDDDDDDGDDYDKKS